jgi:hypothetical protein
LFFSFFFLLHHPTLFRWKRALRFASPGLALAPRFCHPRLCGDPFFAFLPCTSCLLMRAYLKTERLPWGSPTATTPFAPLDFALCVFVILAVKVLMHKTILTAKTRRALRSIRHCFSFFAYLASLR